MGHMGAPSLVQPLLPAHPPLLRRDKCGERTVYVSPDCPQAMERANGQWGLGDYHLLKQLYKGKASTLYHATCRQSGAAVALKLYSKRRLSELNWYQVEREIRLHSQLRHPNIIQLHAAFEDDTHVFMVCEFAAGGDLYEDLKRSGGQLKERQVAGEVLPPFMAALAHMHSRCIIHRDIKPENILLAGDRGVRVADFGLSINWEEERPVTRAGTLDYMSPEVLLCPEKSRPEENKERMELGYGEAVDVWAAGILAYELLVGRPPFEQESREETYACISKKEPALPGWMSEHAKDFITTALAKSARKRPSMAELLRHPWIQHHARRPSAPLASRAASDLHLPLHELGAPPFAELHRPSLHGAQSSRDLAGLLLSPSSTLNATLRSSAVTATPPLPGQGTLRPTTANSSSRLGPHTAPTRPGTPTAATLAATAAAIEASLPPSAFAAAAVQAEGAFDSQPASGSPAHVGSRWQDGMEVDRQQKQQLQQQPRQLQQPSVAAPLSTATSIQPTSPAVAATAARHASLVSAQSSTTADLDCCSPTMGSTHSFTHGLTAALGLGGLPDTHHHHHQQQQASPTAPPGGEQPSAFLDLCKSMALPTATTPRASPMGRKDSGSRPAGSAGSGGRSSSSSSRQGGDAALPPLQQHPALGRLPSLRKALSQPLLHAELPPVSAAVAVSSRGAGMAVQGATELAAAAPVAEVGSSGSPAAPLDLGGEHVEHVALPPIPEQGSSEAEVPSQPDSGHLMLAAAAAAPGKEQCAARRDAAAAAAAAAEPAATDSIPALRAASGSSLHRPIDKKQMPQQERQEQQEQPPPQQQGWEQAEEPPMRTAQMIAHDRMQEAEQRHVEKLRAQSASAVLAPAAEVPAAATAVAAPAAAAASHRKHQLDKDRLPPAASSNSGIAKSATTLLNKILGRKPAAVSTARAAAAAPPVPASAAARGLQAAASPAAAVGRSASSSTSASSAAGQAELPTRTPSKHRLSPPPVSIGGRAAGSGYGQPGSPSSPRQLPPEPHSTSRGGLVHRRVPPASKPAAASAAAKTAATASGSLRSRAGPAPRAQPSRAAPQPPEAAAVAADVLSAGFAAALAASGWHNSSTSGVSPEEEQAVEPRSHSKSVHFAGLAHAGHSCGSMDLQDGDLIPAFHSQPTSFTSAVSSLPSLTSGTGTGTSSPHRVSSRKGSFSPPVSSKGSLAALGGAGPYGAAKPRSSKTTSMPGEAARARPAGTVSMGAAKQAAGTGVQRTAASWSHPVTASAPSDGGSGKKPASQPRKPSPTEIRLSMYRIALGPGAGAGSSGGGGAGGKPPAAASVIAKR